MNAEQFDCSTCMHKHCNDSNPCSYNKWIIPDVIESKTCLLPMITGESEQFLSLYPHYRRGFLPFAGGILNQPHSFNEAMRIIDSVKAEE